jgi:hypothetical protein
MIDGKEGTFWRTGRLIQGAVKWGAVEQLVAGRAAWGGGGGGGLQWVGGKLCLVQSTIIFGCIQLSQCTARFCVYVLYLIWSCSTLTLGLFFRGG